MDGLVESVAVERTDSCKISVNAKGDIAFEIKAYQEDIEEACDKATAAFEKMKAWKAQQVKEN